MRIYRDVEGLADPAIGADKRRVEENPYWAGNPDTARQAAGTAQGTPYRAGNPADTQSAAGAGNSAYGAPSGSGNPTGEAPSDTGAPVYGGASGAGWNTDKTDTEV